MSATKITNTKELKELDVLMMNKSNKLVDLEKQLNNSRESLRIPNQIKSNAVTSRKTLS